MTITRNDIYVRDEKGADWFQEFLQSFAKSKPASVQDILDAINNKRSATVEDVVAMYRDQVGLDLVASDSDEHIVSNSNINSTASVLGPISPMKLKKLKNPDDILDKYDDSDIIIQIKLDGFKTQAIKDAKGKVKIYTRRGEEFTDNVPDLQKDLDDKLANGSFMLGEFVWEDKSGKQSISDIQTVVGSSPEKAHEKLKEPGKAIFYVYDLLWENNKDITKKPYTYRYDKLKKLMGKGTKSIKVVDNYSYSEKDKAINDALKANAEGIVLKPKDSVYKYGPKGSTEPHGEWAKFKPGAKAKTDEVILNKYEKAEEKLVFPMYQYKEKELVEVGKISGMSKEDEAKIKKDIDAGKSVVIEVTFQEVTPAGKFRHVGWSRFRPDKSAREVKMSKASCKYISKRAEEVDKSDDVVILIMNDESLKNAIDSLLEHSGGSKSSHSIINWLRNKLGKEKVSYTDDNLINYIKERQEYFKQNLTEDPFDDIGRIGTDHDYTDTTADYINHGTSGANK